MLFRFRPDSKYHKVLVLLVIPTYESKLIASAWKWRDLGNIHGFIEGVQFYRPGWATVDLKRVPPYFYYVHKVERWN